MPPQDNQGNLPNQPGKPEPNQTPTPEPQVPGSASTPGAPVGIPGAEQPAASPTNPLASPAPTVPTNAQPNTPGTLGAAGTPNPAASGGNNVPLGTPGTAPGGSAGRKRIKLVGIGAGILVVILAALFLLPFSPFAIMKGIPRGPQMMVGDKNKFVYACSVLDNDTVGKELGLNQDKSKQNVEESFSFDPSNKKDKSVDLIKLTGEKYVTSSCKVKFDRVLSANETTGQQEASFINVTAYVDQYPSEQEATAKFNSGKGALGSKAKTLSSYGDSSYFTVPAKPKSGPTYVQPVIKHKNMLIYFVAPLKSDDAEATKMAGQLNNLTKDVLKRIDAKEGEKPKSFSGVTSIGKNKFLDACHGVNYASFAEVLGGDAQFQPTSFSATQGYAPNDNDGKSPKNLVSLCSFDFRTKADADAAGTSRPTIPTGDEATDLGAEDTGFKSFYPHFALVQILTTEKKEDAQKIVADFKKSGESQQQPGTPKIEDVKMGDAAIKVDSPHDETNPYDGKLYYVAKGTHTYLISVSYKRQDKPFKTTSQGFSDEQAKKILDILSAAK